jgi:hypothetical protein
MDGSAYLAFGSLSKLVDNVVTGPTTSTEMAVERPDEDEENDEAYARRG